MASNAPSIVDIRRAVAGDSPLLTPVEKTAYEFCRQRAREGKPVTQMDITLAIGSQNHTGGTSAGVLNRLETKGVITRTFYQRGLQVCFPDTGECTAEPASRATHWRQRTEDVPTPPIARVRDVHHVAAFVIEAEARKAGLNLQDFLMELVFNGLELYLEKEGVTA